MDTVTGGSGMRVAVIISTWTGHPTSYLSSLCASLRTHPAGRDFHLVVCANGLEYSPPEALAPCFAEVFVRENIGFNLAAWDHAWRRLPGYDYYLFLQDDCRVLKPQWLDCFVRRFDSVPRCGLVGENLLRSWNKPWSDIFETRNGGKVPEPKGRAEAARYYHDKLKEWSIIPGATARHLTSVVHFTSRSVLEEVDGYNLARTKGEAIAAEIGFSRKIESLGYALAQLGRRSHSMISHRQWPSGGLVDRFARSLCKRFSGSFTHGAEQP